MLAKIGRGGLAILTVIALIALIGSAVACSDDEATTTTVTGGSTETSATESTDSTPSSTDVTIVDGSKSLDDYRAEIPELEKALEANPGDLYILESLAVAHYQLREYAEAEAAYLKILGVAEDAFTRNNLGNVYRDWDKTEEAKAAYRKAIDTDPTLKYPYVNLAGILQREGAFDEARELLQSGIDRMSAEDKGMLEAAEDKMTTTTT